MTLHHAFDVHFLVERIVKETGAVPLISEGSLNENGQHQRSPWRKVIPVTPLHLCGKWGSCRRFTRKTFPRAAWLESLDRKSFIKPRPPKLPFSAASAVASVYSNESFRNESRTDADDDTSYHRRIVAQEVVFFLFLRTLGAVSLTAAKLIRTEENINDDNEKHKKKRKQVQRSSWL